MKRMNILTMNYGNKKKQIGYLYTAEKEKAKTVVCGYKIKFGMPRNPIAIHIHESKATGHASIYI